MKRKNLEKFEKVLEENGYKKAIHGRINNEDYYWYKAFHKEDNKFEENRARYQLIFRIYDYSQFSYLNPTLEDNIGITIAVMVSRTVLERLDLLMSFDENMKISEIEDKAELFYEWVQKEYPEPKLD